LYATFLSLFGTIGMARVWRRYPQYRAYIHIWLAAFLLVVITIIVTTRSISTSQGRVMFPGLGPLAIFVAAGLFLGWRRRITFLLVLPLMAITLIVPVTALVQAYPQLRPVDALPADVLRLDAHVGDMVWQAYHLRQDTVAPGDTLHMNVYFSGAYPRDLVLQAKALDPLNPVELGGTHLFPGMTFTSQLPPGDTIYRVPVAFTIDQQAEPLAPRQLRIFLDVLDGEQALDDQLVKIPWQNANGADLPGSLNVPGPTLIDPAYVPPTPAIKTDVQFGDTITLAGYTLSADQAQPGGMLDVLLLWHYRQPMKRDWTVTVGLFDANHQIMVQADGMPAGYPTSSARPGSIFPDRRVLPIPMEAAAGDYRLFVGWYDGSERLLVSNASSIDNLYIVPDAVSITEGG
jgi:hypothetical protein